MSRPSAPLVERLGQILESRGLSVAALALRTGIHRDRLQPVLNGTEAMTVDELIQLSQGLELAPEDLVLDGVPEPDMLPYEPPSASVDSLFAEEDVELSVIDAVDPMGNHVRQLFEVGFGLGCTFFFQAETSQLQDSGVPAAVLKQYRGGEVPIQLDAAYHAYNEPEFDAHGVTMKLSFDAVYTCTFPWSSIQRIAFFPEVPEPEDEPEEDDDEPPSGGPPFLRLVE